MTNPIPTVIEVDCTSGISTERPMTADEVANMDAMRIAAEERRAAEVAEAMRISALKESARAKLMAAQPLTADEAAVLVI